MARLAAAVMGGLAAMAVVVAGVLALAQAAGWVSAAYGLQAHTAVTAAAGGSTNCMCSTALTQACPADACAALLLPPAAPAPATAAPSWWVVQQRTFGARASTTCRAMLTITTITTTTTTTTTSSPAAASLPLAAAGAAAVLTAGMLACAWAVLAAPPVRRNTHMRVRQLPGAAAKQHTAATDCAAPEHEGRVTRNMSRHKKPKNAAKP